MGSHAISMVSTIEGGATLMAGMDQKAMAAKRGGRKATSNDEPGDDGSAACAPQEEARP